MNHPRRTNSSQYHGNGGMRKVFTLEEQVATRIIEIEVNVYVFIVLPYPLSQLADLHMARQWAEPRRDYAGG